MVESSINNRHVLPNSPFLLNGRSAKVEKADFGKAYRFTISLN